MNESSSIDQTKQFNLTVARNLAIWASRNISRKPDWDDTFTGGNPRSEPSGDLRLDRREQSVKIPTGRGWIIDSTTRSCGIGKERLIINDGTLLLFQDGSLLWITKYSSFRSVNYNINLRAPTLDDLKSLDFAKLDMRKEYPDDYWDSGSHLRSDSLAAGILRPGDGFKRALASVVDNGSRIPVRFDHDLSLPVPNSADNSVKQFEAIKKAAERAKAIKKRQDQLRAELERPAREAREAKARAAAREREAAAERLARRDDAKQLQQEQHRKNVADHRSNWWARRRALCSFIFSFLTLSIFASAVMPITDYGAGGEPRAIMFANSLAHSLVLGGIVGVTMAALSKLLGRLSAVIFIMCSGILGYFHYCGYINIVELNWFSWEQDWSTSFFNSTVWYLVSNPLLVLGVTGPYFSFTVGGYALIFVALALFREIDGAEA